MKKVLFTLLLICFCLTSNGKEEKATIIESVTTMKTYGFSDPDPIANPDNKYYPYWRFSQYDNISKDKQWKTVTLENDYIKVTMFPEIGGKIWGALDKTRNKEFVYYNHVVKFRDIAMRGAWVSGGIEFNFGIIGHIPSTATPVNYKTQENSDGSVSCFISSYELITRTYWNVEVRLPSDKAYFTTSVTWSNTTPLEQPYYQWMNGAFKADGDLQICAPGNNYIGHAGDSHNYPIDEQGNNLRKYKDMTFGHDISIHILGGFGNYYGAYWNDDDFGFVHCCRQDEKLGRKFFSWSQAREGEIWKDLLTDNDGQYVEIQSGRMFNQPIAESMLTPYKHHSFTPMGTDKWTEYWYPVENIGAYNDASKIGAITVEHENDSIRILISPVISAEKELRVFDGKEKVFQSGISLRPLSVITRSFAYKGNGKLKFIIGDNELVYDEEQKTRMTERPLEIPDDFNWNTTYGHYILGEQYLNIRYFEEADKQLDSSLTADKYFVPALDKKALLCLQKGYAESAAGYLKRALSINTYDGEANYLWGIANLQLKNLTIAKDGFSVATFTQQYRSAAYTMLATIAFRENCMDDCICFINKALEAEPTNIQALQIKCAYLRKNGQKQQSIKLVEEILKETPLNPIVRYEKSLLDESSKDSYLKEFRCEMPEQDLIETALWYMNLELNSEVLSICDMTEFPIAKYIKGYILKESDMDSAKKAVEEANSSSPYLVFPFRVETMDILDWAESVSPSWKINYYKALIEWNRNDTIKALDNLNKCDDSDFAPLFISRASLKNGDEILKDLQKAEKLDESWRVGDRIIQYYSDNSMWKDATETAEKYFKLYHDKYEIGLKYANALCESGEYEMCLKVLNQFKVMPNEGARTGHVIYRKANLKQACKLLKEKKYSGAIKAVENSKIWNEDLGVGKPYEYLIDYSTENEIIDAAKAKNWQKADSIIISD